MEFKLLSEILDELPLLVDKNGKLFKPKFDYGTQADLLKFLLYKKRGKNRTNTYPLVWLQTPVAFNKTTITEYADVNFILAVNSSRDITNRKRTSISFIQLLDPLLLSVVNAINLRNGIRISNKGQVIKKYFNYENDTEKGATDIWDAISFQVRLEINLDCIN